MAWKIVLTLLFLSVPLWAGNNLIPACDFKRLFHRLVQNANTTTLRKELKVMVTDARAKEFITEIEKILKDDQQPNPKLKRMTFREVPDSADDVFFTQTEYLPKFQGIDEEGKSRFNGIIRIRNYLIAPVGTTSQQVAESKNLKIQPLADQPGNYAKLEFKMGHVRPDAEGLGEEMTGVVEKPTITLERKDIDLLLQDLRTYEAHKEEIFERARNLTLTTPTKKLTVNNSSELREMIERIGQIHRAGFSLERLSPAYQTLYQRTARRISFDTPKENIAQGMPKEFEVQITVDRDVRVTQRKGDTQSSLADTDRIVELKIPIAYAELPDDVLKGMGLSDLAQIRALYQSLPPQPGTERGQGKRSLTHKKTTQN